MNGFRYPVVACLLTLLSACPFADAGANLLVNGSFESGPYINGAPGGYVTCGLNDARITGWIVTDDNVDHVGSTFFQPSDGARSIDLNGLQPGALAQTFATSPGATYLVTFDMAGNPGAAPTVKTMRVSAAGSFADFNFNISGKSTTSMGWVNKSWSFVALSTSTTIEFRSLDSPPTLGGPALDRVVVDLVPPAEVGNGARSPSGIELTMSPNPVRAAGLIRLGLPSARMVVVDVFDTNGRRVREITAGPLGQGKHELRWDGRGEDGRPVASGIYFVRARAGKQATSVRFLLLH